MKLSPVIPFTGATASNSTYFRESSRLHSRSWFLILNHNTYIGLPFQDGETFFSDRKRRIIYHPNRFGIISSVFDLGMTEVVLEFLPHFGKHLGNYILKFFDLLRSQVATASSCCEVQKLLTFFPDLRVLVEDHIHEVECLNKIYVHDH